MDALAEPKGREEREAQQEQFREFMKAARREVEQDEIVECFEMESAIDDFTRTTVDKEYVPLRYHLMNYQKRNVLKEHSKLTPQNEKSIFNFYTGGEGQTEEQMRGIKTRYESLVASNMATCCTSDESEIDL